MSGRQRFGGCAVLVLVAFAGGRAAGQDPDETRVDPDVRPAQYVQPAGPGYQPNSLPPPPSGLVADPPTPVVNIQVRVPAHIAPGKDISYRLVVSNTSRADAYRVKVRDVLPPGTTAVLKTDPAADPPAQPRQPNAGPPEVLEWSLHTLKPGDRREIEFTIKVSGETKELANKAFVSFEHGQAVITKIDRPKLAVRKAAPEKAAVGDRIPVRVEVVNTGRVPLPGVKLVESVPAGFDFVADGEGERTNQPNQRQWALGTLAPGQRKTVEYTLTAREAVELAAQSHVSAPDAPDPQSAESKTRLLRPDLALDFTGPPSAAAGEPAAYTAKVTNTGTLPLTAVRVTVAVPPGCTVTRMTNGGRRDRDQLVWTLPPDRENGPLKPGQDTPIRFWLKSGTTGLQTVRAVAEGPRGLEKSAECKTAFQGTADLLYTAKPEPAILSASGGPGLLTIVVQNRGGEAAQNVRLRIEVPPQVRVEQASPTNQIISEHEIVFKPRTIDAGKSEKYTLTLQGSKPGQAVFNLKLEADALGDKPLPKTVTVEVTSGER